MDAKHRTVQLLGIAALSSGSLLGLLAVGRLPLWRSTDVWAAIDLTFVIGLAAYLISLGMRGLGWASGHESGRDGQIKWGRVYLGALLIFIEIKNHLHPGPNLLKPSNEGEAAGMILTAIVLAIVGA